MKKIGIIIIVLICLGSLGYVTYEYLSSNVKSSIASSNNYLATGNYKKAVEAMQDVFAITSSQRQAIENQEIVLRNYDNIAIQLNGAINYANNEQYGPALQILNTLHTDNKYLNNKIQNITELCNSSYPLQIYEKGEKALEYGNLYEADKDLEQEEELYPNSQFAQALTYDTTHNTPRSYSNLNIKIQQRSYTLANVEE
ncbi:hypothetical protein ACED96_05060 [Clostridium thermobutyricum]|uniref:hypothetical protein n=1 Tax=Clostridium thermobutyricum TaxID=29372 RepID=UPI0018AC09CC|nr:hypothetical protein [Clostridium thermobutyricum]